jgi:L-lactate dehydrogenase (cytochrome)
MRMNDYMGFIDSNFDPSIGWSELEWIRDFWKGKLIIKGLLDPDDARDAKRLGADGIVVSNHGGRQLDGAVPTARALPGVVDAVGTDLTVLVDSGIRSGLDDVRMLALGAKGVLLGRAYVYALAAAGQRSVSHLLELFAADMKVTMTLIGAKSLADITRNNLESTAKEIRAEMTPKTVFVPKAVAQASACTKAARQRLPCRHRYLPPEFWETSGITSLRRL